VVWIHDDGSVTTPMYAMYNGSTWSAPAVLPVGGLPAGGRINGVTLGSNGIGRIDVLMSYIQSLPDGTTTSTLYDRPSNITNFGNIAQPPMVEPVAEGATYSGLRTVPDPQGGMFAYWQQTDGVNNEVYEAHLSTPAQGSVWSQPMRLSTNPDLTFNPSMAPDVGASGENLVVVYHTKPAVATATGTFHSPSLGSADAPVPGLAVGSGVATSMVPQVPDPTFSQGLFFPYRGTAPSDGAPAGSIQTAQAQIVNHGLAGASVQLNFTRNGVVVDPPQTIFLSPGNTYDIKHDFQVAAGSATYAISVTAAGNTSDSDDTSTATLQGLEDLAVTDVTPSDPNPKSGEALTVKVTETNLSNQALPAYSTALYLGDPRLVSAANPPPLVATLKVPSLGPNQSTTLMFPWVVPPGQGDYTLVALADSAKVLAEVSRANNYGQVNVRIQADPALVTVFSVIGGSKPPISVKLLNYSGKNNVEVDGRVNNLGGADAHSVPVRLLWSHDGGPFQVVADLAKPLFVPAFSFKTFQFLAPGLAGENRYRLVVNPELTYTTAANVTAGGTPTGSVQYIIDNPNDANPGNNVAEVALQIQGQPDLTPVKARLVETQTPAQGQALTVAVQVDNIGIGTAEQILVEVFAEGTAVSNLLVGHATIDKMEGLSKTIVDIPIDTSKLQSNVVLTVVVDRLEKILETNHFNNTLAFQVHFYPKDTTAPQSHVQLLPAVQHTTDFTVKWQGTDGNAAGSSGIAFYDILVSVDGAAFALWQHTAAHAAVYHGQEGHHYAFYSVATDNSGNQEAAATTAEAQTTIPAPAAEIRGNVFNDLNIDRKLNAGEPGLSGWTVYLDLNHDGHLDPGDPFTTTDQNGDYAFTGLRAGAYTVAEVPQLTWVQASPATPSPAAPEPPPGHFLLSTGPGTHYTWAGQDLSRTDVTTIFYDFRPEAGFANHITAAEKQATIQALQAWSNASLGRLHFVQNTKASIHNIINIGVGDLKAVGGPIGPGVDLSRGGASIAKGLNLSDGVAWLNFTDNWDTTIGNGNPPGTFDFFTAVAHEIGLALGLFESPDRTASDIMGSTYNGPLTTFSAGDRADIQALYPLVPPTPGQRTYYTVLLSPGQVAKGLNFGNHLVPPS
jgi:hypothetical protein